MGRVYTVIYEWDPGARAWSALVQDVPGCHSQGRSLRDAMANIREALELWLNLGEDEHLTDAGVHLIDRPKVPGLETEVSSIAQERNDLERGPQRCRSAPNGPRSIWSATISMRDAAVMLGLSHQRIGQLAGRGGLTRTDGSIRPKTLRSRGRGHGLGAAPTQEATGALRRTVAGSS